MVRIAIRRALSKRVLIPAFCAGILNSTSYAQIGIPGLAYPKTSEMNLLQKKIQETKSTMEKVAALNRLATYYVQTPYPRTPNINNAFRLASEAAAISERNHLQKQHSESKLLVAYTYLRKNMLDSAVAILPVLNDSARYHLLLPICNYLRVKDPGNRDTVLQRAMRFALEAEAIGKRNNDTLMKILARQEIAGIRSDYNDPKIDSDKELSDILKLQQGIGYPHLQYIYVTLAASALSRGQEDKALQYSSLALKALAQSTDSAWAADLFLVHGIILRRIGNANLSIEYLKKATEVYKHWHGEGNIGYCVRIISDEFVKAKRPEEGDRFVTQVFREYPPDNRDDSLQQLDAMATFFRVTKRYDKAEKYMLMYINLLKSGGGPVDFVAYKDLGQIYMESGQYAKAKPNLTEALKLIDNRASIRTKGHLYYCLFLTDSALGNYLSAIRYLSENKRWDDSLITQSKVEAIQKYQTQFETEKKEDSLKFKDEHISLLTQTTNLQQENLRQSYLVRNITIAGIILAAIVITLLYLQYRAKQKSNTVISKKNDQLQKLVNEKEWLLKEVHHRVKNNLQTVVSLLELQSEYLDSDALSAIQASQNRIYATSLLHQKLYRSENISSVNMNGYLHELIQYLKDAYNIRNEIRFVTNITPVELDVTQAVPLGLIVNEAITNSFKYAFDKQTEDAEIMLSLTMSEGTADLLIADNGKGFPAADGQEPTGIGLKLIKGLAEDIDGDAQIDSIHGTHIIIRFKPRLRLESVVNHEEESIV